MSQIAPAFIKAKQKFGPALKDKTNPAFRSKYADLGACLEAVDDALLSNGIALYQETFDDPSGVTVETVLLHESGEMIRCGKLHVPAAKQDPQGYGSALTYARRYSLMTACGIAPEDDDGNAASKLARTKSTTQAVQPPAGLTESAVLDHLAAIQSASSMDELKSAYEKAYIGAKAANDVGALAKFDLAKESRKTSLAQPATA